MFILIKNTVWNHNPQHQIHWYYEESTAHFDFCECLASLVNHTGTPCFCQSHTNIRGGFKTQPPVPSGSRQLSLFRTIETARNRTEPAVNQRLGFEVVPKFCTFRTSIPAANSYCWLVYCHLVSDFDYLVAILSVQKLGANSHRLKGVLHPRLVFGLFLHFSQKLQHIGNK